MKTRTAITGVFLRASMLLVSVASLAPGAREVRADTAIVVAGGTADEHARTTAVTAIEGAAREAGWSLATKRLSKKESDGILSCKDPTPYTCVPASLDASGIHHVLVVRVDSSTTDTGIPQFVVVAKLIAMSPHDVVFNRRYCERCADDGLRDESTKLAQEILRLNAKQSGRTVIQITSNPPGAAIALDGERIGVTDASYNTFPGNHIVILEKSGYESVTQEIKIDEGKTGKVAVTLPASAAHPPITSVSVKTPPASHVVPAVVLTVGGVALVGGVVLYEFNEGPSLTGGKRYLDSAPAGITVGVAGAVTIAVGLYLWHHASSTAADTTSAPIAAPVPGGAVVGWSGRF